MEDIEWGRAVPSKGPSVTAGDVYASAIEESRRVSNINARDENLFDAYEDVNGRIKHATGKDVANPFGFNAPVTPVATGGYGYSRFPKQKDPVAEWRRTIADIKNKHPDAMPWDGIENEPERIANERMRATRDATTELHERTGLVDAERIPYLGKVPVARSVAALGVNLATHPQLTVAEFAGGLRGQLYSPVDTFSNLVGFGAGTATDSILKAALKNAIVNASVQVPLSGLKQSDYKQAGLPSGWDVWLSEVEGAAGAGFFLDAGIRAPGRAAIKAFGRDAPAGAMLSRNTERGGWLMDAPDKLDLPPAPVSRPPVEAETVKKAMANDVAAVREVAEKTGAIEDPAVKGAIHYAETTGPVDNATVAFFRAAQIDDGEGLRVLQAAMNGSDHVRIPVEVAQAKTPLMRDEAAVLLSDKAPQIVTSLSGLDARTGRLIQDGLDAGLPEIVKAVQAHLAHPGDLGKAMTRIAEDMGGPQKLADQVTIHSGHGGILAVAEAMRRSPELVDGNVSLRTDFMFGARAIGQLDDAAFARVMRGDITPSVAALVSDMVPPEMQDRVMGDLAKAGIRDAAAAREAIPALIPIAKSDSPIDRGASIKAPNDAAAKAQTARLEVAHAESVAEAMAPIEARRQVEVKIETLKGEIAKLEERQDAEIGKPLPEAKAEPETAPNPVVEAVSQIGDAVGVDVRPLLETPEQRPAAKPSATQELIAKRSEIDAAVVEKASLDAEIDGKPDPSPLYRMVMESAALQRAMDVRRAVDDALRLAQRMLPPGTKVDVVGREMFDPVTGSLIDAFSDIKTGDVTLATYALNPAARIGHEGVHTLVTRGLVSPQEIRLLADMARRTDVGFDEAKYREAYKDRASLDALIEEEAAAHLIEAVIKRKVNVDTPTGTIARIKTMLQRVKNALNGYGFQTADDLARAIVNGDVAQRQALAKFMRAIDQGDAGRRENKVGTMFALSQGPGRAMDPIDPVQAKAVLLQDFGFRSVKTKGGDNVAVDAVRAARLISEVTGVDAASMGRVLNLRLRSTRGSTNAGSFRGFGRWLGGTVRLDANSSTGSVAVHEFAHAIDQAARNQRVGIGMATEKPNPIDRLFLASTMVPVVNIVTTPVMVAAKLIDRYAFRGRMLADRMRKNYPWMTPRVAQGFADLAAVLDQGKDAAQGRGDAPKTAEDAAFLTMTRTGEAKEKAWSTYRDAKAAAGDVYPYPPEVDAALAKVEKAIDDHAAASKAWAQWTDKRLQPETVFEGSLNADGGQNGHYYSQPSEMFARAFEVYVRDKAERIYTPSQVTAMLGKDSVGPEYARRGGSQREAIGTALDKIFDGIRANVAAIAAGDKPDTGTLFALRDAETGRSMREDLDALGYYSGALRAAKALRQSKGTPEQMLAMLQKKGAKKAEIEATGLDKALQGKASVTKDEIIAHMEKNRVGLMEVQRETLEAYNARLAQREANGESVFMPDGMPDNEYVGAPKWSNYSLDPSNPTYRETVLHIAPEKRGGIDLTDFETGIDRGPSTDPRAGPVFQSGHFPEPNITGHMMTSMTRHEGKPVYTIDQIQSDWGQKLRDGGVRDEARIAKARKAVDEFAPQDVSAWINQYGGDFDRAFKAADKVGHDKIADWILSADEYAEGEYRRLLAELDAAEAAAPGHPLVNTTDQWTTTTLRRALRQAVEADADYIAIPHGDTVLSYNPGDEHGMRSFYGDRGSEGIVPKNLRKILSRIDKDGTAPVKVATLETPSGERGYRPDNQGGFDRDQTGFTVFPLSDKVKAAVVDEGQAMFAIRDDRHGTQGLDMTQNAPPPEPPPPLHTEVAVLDRMSRMTELVMACR